MSIENAARKLPEYQEDEVPQAEPTRTLEAANDNEESQPITTIEPFANDNEPEVLTTEPPTSDEQQLAEVKERLGMFVPIDTVEEIPQLSEESIEAAIEEIGSVGGGNAENVVALAQAAGAGAAAGGEAHTPEGSGGGSVRGGAEGGFGPSGALKVLLSILKFGGLLLATTFVLMLNGLRMASDQIITKATGVKVSAGKKKAKAGGGHGDSHGGGGHH